MTDDRLDALMASMAPISEAQAAELPLSGPEADLMEAIMSTTETGPRAEPADTTDVDRAPIVIPLARPRHRSRRILAALAVAAAVLVAALAWQQSGGEDRTAWAADLVEMAETSPRLLLDRPGWAVTRAEHEDNGRGEMVIEGDGQGMLVSWRAADELGSFTTYYRDDDSIERLDDHQVAGQVASVYRYDEAHLAIWVLGGHAVRVWVRDISHEAFLDLVDSLHAVDVDTWLEAMPPSVVKPGGRQSAVDAMLADIPLPAGFDASELRAGDAVRERYHLGADVSGAVACAWIEQWVEKTDAGDVAGATEAVDAMATSHRWAILLEMDVEGDYPESIWAYADAMAAGPPDSGDMPLTIRESYPGALGCNDR